MTARCMHNLLQVLMCVDCAAQHSSDSASHGLVDENETCLVACHQVQLMLHKGTPTFVLYAGLSLRWNHAAYAEIIAA